MLLSGAGPVLTPSLYLEAEAEANGFNKTGGGEGGGLLKP